MQIGIYVINYLIDLLFIYIFRAIFIYNCIICKYMEFSFIYNCPISPILPFYLLELL